VTLRETRKGDEHSNSSRYYSCGKEHENLLEEMRQVWQKKFGTDESFGSLER